MKLCLILLGILALLIVIPLGAAALARPRITDGEPTKLSQLQSLGDLIAKAGGKHIHVIYVHGMRAEKPGDSEDLRKKLIERFGQKGEVVEHREPLELAPWPQDAHVGTIKIWDRKEDWDAGQPFVDRTVLTTGNDVTITIDEVNWWPLLFPLKCRVLLQPEAILAGVDKPHLDLCTNDNAPYHRWISKEDYDKALSTRPALGGGTRINRGLKQQIMDWGLSDAVITLGPMRAYVDAAIEAAFNYASENEQVAEYVVISESLGSFVVLDAYARADPAVKSVLDRTYNLYFLANQFALLELARITQIPKKAARVQPGTKDISGLLTAEEQGVQRPASPVRALKGWAAKARPAEFMPPISSVKQIIAFSDPNDLLTFRVPEVGNARVANVYVRIARPILGLYADPATAHSGHWKNSAVWDAMLK